MAEEKKNNVPVKTTTAAVKKDGVEIDDHTLADGYPLAVVAVKRRDNKRRRMRMGQQIQHTATILFHIPRAALVQRPHRLVGVQDAPLYLLVRIVIRQVVDHLLVFSHRIIHLNSRQKYKKRPT